MTVLTAILEGQATALRGPLKTRIKPHSAPDSKSSINTLRDMLKSHRALPGRAITLQSALRALYFIECSALPKKKPSECQLSGS